MACSLRCGFKRGIASVSKLILTIIEIFKPFIPLPKHENHEHLTIQNCYCKVGPTKGGRFECSTTSNKNHYDTENNLKLVLIYTYTLNRKRNVAFKENIFNTEIIIKNVIFENICVN
jgi:hypothetical protein